MSNIYTSVVQLIGKTPLLELTNIAKKDGLKARVLAKLEGCNPAGSAKDRVGLSMILDAEEKGILKPGSVIIEQVFSVPGIGRLLLTSIFNRDYPVAEAIVVILAFWVVLCNLLGDLLSRRIDPRLESGEGGGV